MPLSIDTKLSRGKRSAMPQVRMVAKAVELLLSIATATLAARAPMSPSHRPKGSMSACFWRGAGEFREAGVEVHGEPERLCGVVDRVPMGIFEARQPEPLELVREEDAPVAKVGDTFDLSYRGLDVPERNHADRDETARVCAGKVGEEVVVSAGRTRARPRAPSP